VITLNRTSGITIPRKYEKEDWYVGIKRKLTRHSREYQRSTFITNQYFLEGINVLKIPRFFPVEDYIDDFKIIDNIHNGQDIKINHNIKLRDDLQRNIVKYMLENKNGIIQANPGSGKTVISIYVIATLKKKAFILIHRDSLADQWIGDSEKGFLAYTDIDKNEIGRLTSHNFKEVLKKSIIVCTDQTFISILKRNREEFLLELNNSNIGIFIADEVHTTVGAPTFAECSIHIPTKIAFGLSATPYRYDGAEDIIKFHLGEIFVPQEKSSTMDARVTVLLFNYGFLPKSHYYLYYGGFFQKSRYLTILKNSKIFMSICYSLIRKFYDEGKQIIFMGERIKLLDLLFANCKCDDKGMFTGSAKLDQIQNRLTFATPGKMRDGIDAVLKDCLIMTSPISNVEQMCGRILRIKKGKSQPIVIDMVDIGIPQIKQTLFGRLDFYKSKNWDVKFIFVTSDGKKNQISEEQVLEILKETK